MDEKLKLKLEILEQKLQSLENENQSLKDREFKRVKGEWEKIKDSLYELFDDGDRVEEKYEGLLHKIRKNKILSLIANANNPTSNKLGFRFVEVISRELERVLVKSFTVEDDRVNFKTIIRRIVKNPIAKAIISTNPFSEIISKVIEKVSVFTRNVIKNPRSKHAYIQSKVVFSEAKIKDFYSGIKKYSDFYEKLTEANDDFREKNLMLLTEVNALSERMKGYHKNNLALLGIITTRGSNWSKVEKLIDVEEDAVENYLSIINNPNIQRTYEESVKFPALKAKVEEFEVKYNTILNKFITDYLQILELIEGFGDAEFDSESLESFKNDLEEFKSDL